MIDYVVYSTSNSDYQSWQCKLLEYSFKKVNQQGKLIRLCSYNTHCPDREFDTSDIAEVIKLPDYRTRWTEYTNNLDKDYGIANKTESLKYWLFNYPGLKDTDTVLLIDPDMVFVKSVNIFTTPGTIIGQRWVDTGASHGAPFQTYASHIKDRITDKTVFMYPYIATVGDLKKIINNYVDLTYKMRLDNYPHLWESEMYSLIISCLEQDDIKVETLDNLGFCTTWNHREEVKNKQFVDSAYILHYPSSILDKEGNTIFNKQDYTPLTRQKHWHKIDPNNATTYIEQKFLQILDNYNLSNTFSFYWKDHNLLDSTTNYIPEEKYLVFRPWPGGFNNIRMSLEIAACIAFLQNRILVLPPEYHMYLLQNTNPMSTFFDISDIGIKAISFEEFKFKVNINSWEEIESISCVVNDDLVDNLLSTEKEVPSNFIKGRTGIKYLNDLNDIGILYFKDNLLGNFYLTIFSQRNPELCKYIARHVHYKEEIFCEASKVVKHLNKYYAIHIRRNDFQYKDLFLSIEEIYNNINEVIPKGSKLYISTDETNKSFFDLLKQYYEIYFYDDIKHFISSGMNVDLIGPVEQIICTEAELFIGNKLSTFSSYIYRLRGYMKHIDDKRFLTYHTKCKPDEEEEYWWIATWAREYAEGWQSISGIKYFHPKVILNKKVFVSIASYRDAQLTDTIDSLFKNQSGNNEIIIGVCMQDTEENYNNFKYKDHPNIRTHFIPYPEAKGVGYARHYIQQYLFQNEDYFLQIDSHSRACPNWDKILIEQISSCPSDKPILSTYPNAFDIADEEETYFNHNTCPYLKINSISPINKKIFCVSAGIVEDKPMLGFWCAAGFLFAKGQWAREVEYSKDLYFTGEEDHLSIMSYVNGWDVYVPLINTIWHDYTDNRSQSEKKYRPLHWEDHPRQNNNIHLLQELHKAYGGTHQRTPEEFLVLAKQLSGITEEDEKINMEVIFDFSDIPLPDKEVEVIIFAFSNKDHTEIFRPDIYDKNIINRTQNKITYRVHPDIYDNIDYCVWMYKYTDGLFDTRLELMVGKKNNKCKIWYL